MRNTFAKEILDCARVDDSIFLVTGDLGYSVLEPFAEEFPDRFLNIGIAEQNMTGVAAGLAKEGYNVFTYSIGNFPTLRCMEQIRYDVCYHNLSVKIVAVGAGYAYGPLGVSHHTTEDLGMLRTIPGLLVTSPSDPYEVAALTKYLCNNRGPGYLRLNKTGERRLHAVEPSILIGEPLKLVTGNKKLILGTGAVLQEAVEFAKSKGWEVWSFPVVSPMGNLWVTEDLLNFDEIITLEEHQLNSGFGSAVLEVLNEAFYAKKITAFPKVKRIGINNKFLGYAGSQEYLKEQSGINLKELA